MNQLFAISGDFCGAGTRWNAMFAAFVPHGCESGLPMRASFHI